MVVSLPGMPVYGASGGMPPIIDSLCQHHPEHNEDCGGGSDSGEGGLQPEAQEQEIIILPAQERDLQRRTLNSSPTRVKYKKAPMTTVTYASSNEKIVTVDEQGNIRYTGLGDAVITIRAAAEKGYKEAGTLLQTRIRCARD